MERRLRLKSLVLTFVTILLTQALPQHVLSREKVCAPEDLKPIARLRLSTEALAEGLEELIRLSSPHAEKTLLNVPLREHLCVRPPGGSLESSVCEAQRSKPGFDSDTWCLYIPGVLLGQPVPLSNLGQSIPTYMNFTNLKLNEFRLDDIQVSCNEGYDTGQGHFCDIKATISKLNVESQFSLIDQRTGETVFTTISPAWITVSSKGHYRRPEVGFRLRVTRSGRASDVLHVDRDSFYIDIPEEAIDSKIENQMEDLLEALIRVISKNNPNMETVGGPDDFTEEILKDLDLSSIGPEAETYLNSFGLITLVNGFLNDYNFAAAHWGQIYNWVAPHLSTHFAEQVEAHLPLNKVAEIRVPVQTGQEIAYRAQYAPLLEANYLFFEREVLSLIQNPDLRPKSSRVKRAFNNLKKVEDAIIALGETSIPKMENHIRITQELTEDYLNLIKEQNPAAWVRVIEQGQKVIEAAKIAQKNIQKNMRASDKSSKLALTYFHPVDRTDHLGVIVSACQLSGKSVQSSYSFRENRYISPPDIDYDFSIAAPIEVMNEYLETLYRLDYFQACLSRDINSCVANDRSGPRTEYNLGRPPKIVYDSKEDRYILWIPELERDRVSFLGPYLSRAFFSETTDVKVCLDASFDREGISADCLALNADFAKNLRAESLSAILHPVSAIGMLGWKLFRTFGQKMVLNGIVKHGVLLREAERILDQVKQIELVELRARNDLVSFYGRLVPAEAPPYSQE